MHTGAFAHQASADMQGGGVHGKITSGSGNGGIGTSDGTQLDGSPAIETRLFGSGHWSSISVEAHSGRMTAPGESDVEARSIEASSETTSKASALLANASASGVATCLPGAAGGAGPHARSESASSSEVRCEVVIMAWAMRP
jgi:hypothetical protein